MKSKHILFFFLFTISLSFGEEQGEALAQQNKMARLENLVNTFFVNLLSI